MASRTPEAARRARLVAVLLMLANPLLHKPVSAVCDWARTRWGFEPYNRTALVAIPLASLVIVSPALMRRRAVLLRPATVTNVLILSAVSLAAQRWLLVANIELIHLPQFALLVIPLLAAGLDAPSAYLVSTAAGALDETYQHLVTYAGVEGTYFDVNDIVLNAIGAAWGIVLFAETFGAVKRATPMGAPDAPEQAIDSAHDRRRWRYGAALAILALAVVLWLDPPRLSPFLSPTKSGRLMYRVLSSAEGLMLCTVLWGMTRPIGRTQTAGQPLRPAWT